MPRNSYTQKLSRPVSINGFYFIIIKRQTKEGGMQTQTDRDGQTQRKKW